MAEKIVKRGWYDGWVYGKFLDPLTGKPFEKLLKKMIKNGSTVLDLGCGTGATVSGISDICKKVVGMDISPKMIDYAKKNNNVSNGDFILIDQDTELKEYLNSEFDYVILKMVLHEADPGLRDDIVNQLRGIANYGIIADFVYPQPSGFAGIKTFIIESIAGREHYKNFRDWCSHGAIDDFLKKHSLEVISEKMFIDGSGKVVLVSLK